MKKFFLLFLALFIVPYIYGQNKSNFGFDFDYTQFGYDSTSNYIEFYYSFNQSNLTLKKTDSSTYVQGNLKITIEDTASGKKLVDKEWKVINDIKDTSDMNKSLVGVLGFVVPVGEYKIVAVGSDAVEGGDKKMLIDYFKVVPLWKDKTAVSGIQLATRIIQDSPNKNSVFYKNTYEIIPSIVNIFGESQPVVFYYLELYNLKNLPDDNVKLDCIVTNSRGKLMSNKSKIISNNVSSRVEVGTVVVTKYPTGIYTLNEALLDSAANVRISSSKTFYVYNPSIMQSDTVYESSNSALGSEFSVMSEDELNKIFEESKYIASSNEIDQYDGLKTLESKRKFLYEFWKKRDPNPSTTLNEAYRDYMNRVQKCNALYSTMGREGWQTDRGRVYLTYGEPSEIERYPNQQNTKPYEIWHYNDIQGGVVFVFADLTGFSQYMLVNSTMRGEVRDDNWMSRITTN